MVINVGQYNTMPTMPSKKPDYKRVVLYDSSNRDSDSIDASNADKDNPDTDNSSEAGGLRTDIERAIETPWEQTPAMTSPIGCSTAIPPTAIQLVPSGIPIRGREKITGTAEGQTCEGQTDKIRLNHVSNKEIRNKVRFENEIEPRRSERIKTANRVGILGGVEYF